MYSLINRKSTLHVKFKLLLNVYSLNIIICVSGLDGGTAYALK